MKKSVLFAALLVPALALAQPRSADDWYKEGETQYNLGDFEKAADAFKQGFAVETDDSKKPAYLYNVAQAYRMGNRCRDAAFFYKRYLALKDRDTVKPLKPEKRAEIEQRIAELDECARTQDSIANKPPGDTIRPGGDGTKTGSKAGAGTKTGTPAGAKTGTGTGTPAGAKTGTGTGAGTATGVGAGTTTGVGAGTTTGTGAGSTMGTGAGSTTGTGTTAGTGTTVGDVGDGGEVDEVDDGEEEEDGGSLTATAMASPRVINARFVGGVSKISMGDLPTGVKPAFTLTGGYPVLAQGPLAVDVGASFAFSPLPYENGMTGASATASMTTLLANAAATYTVAPKIALRGDLGLGVLMFGGLEMGNPFTEAGAGASAALGMFALRVAASADYAITPNIVATVTPLSLGFSPAKEGLRADVSSILRLEFMAGVGYRL